MILLQYAACILMTVVIQAADNLTPTCENEMSKSYLDLAMDMIQKAKLSYPSCSDTKIAAFTKAADCAELFRLGHNKSGVYTVWPRNRLMEDRSLNVYCNMFTDGGGWTVIQRRGNFHRAVDYFFKDWQSYKEGFGDIDKDFWLGNDYIFALTNQKLYSLRIDLKDVEGNRRYAQYDSFWIDDENNKYMSHIKDYSGDAGDSMFPKHDSQKFSTKDQDNDNLKDGNCAQNYKGGWWYNSCHDSNLNGLYLRGKHESHADGVEWKTWKGHKESMEISEMKIRPRNFKWSTSSIQTPEPQ